MVSLAKPLHSVARLHADFDFDASQYKLLQVSVLQLLTFYGQTKIFSDVLFQLRQW